MRRLGKWEGIWVEGENMGRRRVQWKGGGKLDRGRETGKGERTWEEGGKLERGR